MTDDLWQRYLDSMGSLTRVESERQRRYAAADEEHTRRANRFTAEVGAVERQWKQMSDQAARSKATGDALMRRFRLTAADQPQLTREGAGAALADAEKTITWCSQAARWVSSYQQRARDLEASLPAGATIGQPVPPSPDPAPAGKPGCGPGAAAMLLTLVGASVLTVLKATGAI